MIVRHWDIYLILKKLRVRHLIEMYWDKYLIFKKNELDIEIYN